MPNTPSNLCISEDGDSLYIVYKDGDNLVVELDLNTYEIIGNLIYKIPEDSVLYRNIDVAHRHVYERENRIYVVGGETRPILYVFDANITNTTASAINITSGALSEVGDMLFTDDNKSFFYWQQSGWGDGYYNSAIYKYSVGENSFTLSDQSDLLFFDYPESMHDTPIFSLKNKGTLICNKYEFNSNDITTIMHQFSEPIYAVNSAGTIAAGKKNIFKYDEVTNTWVSETCFHKGYWIVAMFFAGDKLMSLSVTDKGNYFIEEIWYGRRSYISGDISLGFGVKAPIGNIHVRITASNGLYTGETAVYIPEGSDTVSFLIYNLPALPNYLVSYEIFNYSYGNTADDYGYLENGYYSPYIAVPDACLATSLDLTDSYKTADILMIGNRTISGTISLPNGDAAPEGGLLLVMGAANQYGEAYYPVEMPAMADSVSYTLNVPSTAPGYGYDITCYNLFDTRYLTACGFSNSGTVPQKKFSNDVSVKSGNIQGIDITLIKSRVISGYVSLPAGETAPSGGLTVNVNGVNGDFTIDKDVIIPEGQNSVAYELVVPITVNPTISLNVNAYTNNGTQYASDDNFNSSQLLYIPIGEGNESSKYRISYNTSPDAGYQTTGYYGANGMTVSTGAADVDVSGGDNSNTNLTLLRGEKTIQGTVTLPSGTLALVGGQEIFIYAVNNNLEFDPYTVVHIAQGDDSADFTLKVPSMQGYSILYNIDSDSNIGFVPYGYCSTNETTFDKDLASKFDASISNISGVDLRIAAGIAVSGTITASSPLQVDTEIAITLSNKDFMADEYISISKGEQNAPYTIYVPVNNSYYAQYHIASDLNGYLKQGFYAGNYKPSAGYAGSSVNLQINSSAVSNINFTLIPANSMISGTISLPDGSGTSPYYIYMPSSSAGYLINYHLYSDASCGYNSIGYYSPTGTTADYNSIGLIYLSSGNASDINLSLLECSNTIFPAAGFFDKNIAADITIMMTLNGNTLSNIKNGDQTLVNGIDYTVSGNSVVIKKGYLVNLPFGNNALTFNFSAGNSAELSIQIIDSASAAPTIFPNLVNCNKQAIVQQDVTVTMTLNGNTLSNIKNGDQTLVNGVDYTVTGNTTIIKKSYLNGLPTGYTRLTFYFNTGKTCELIILVFDIPSVPCRIDILHNGPNAVIPSSGTSIKSFSAKVMDSSGIEYTDQKVTWSLAGPVEGVSVEGVSIDQNTGLVTITKDAQPGVFLVIAKAGSITSHTIITLYRPIYNTISGTITLTDGVAPEGGATGSLTFYGETISVGEVAIPEGENTVDFSFDIKPDIYSKIECKMSSSKWIWTSASGSTGPIDVTNTNISGLNINISRDANMLSGTVKLSAGVAPAGGAGIQWLFPTPGYAGANVTISEGSNSTDFVIYVSKNITEAKISGYVMMRNGKKTGATFDEPDLIDMSGGDIAGIVLTVNSRTIPDILNVISLASDKQSPQQANTPISWMCQPTDSSGSILYRFSVYSDSTGWQVMQEYTNNYIFNWKPETLGDYIIKVEIKHALSQQTYDGYKQVEYKVVKQILNSTIAPASASFDKKTSAQADISVTMVLNGNTLSSIKNGTSTLVSGTDYAVSGSNVVIKKGYLSGLAKGNAILTFYFSEGNNAELNITITDSTSTGSGTPTGGGAPIGGGVPFIPIFPVGGLSGNLNSGNEPDNGVMTIAPICSDTNAKVEITADNYKALLDSAAEENGIKNLTINVNDVSVGEYNAQLPSSALTGTTNEVNITLNTAVANITLPSNMFRETDVQGAQNIGINVAAADRSTLPESVTKIIGKAPVVDISITVNGDVKPWNNPDAPVTVSIPYTLKDGENPDNITVFYIDGTGNLVNMQGIYDPDTKRVTFTTTHFSKYMVKVNNVMFSDLTGFEGYAGYIESMAAKGIINGIGNNKFAPGKVLTRAEFSKLLVEMLQLDITDKSVIFSDVDTSIWYAPYVNAAYKSGLIKGVGDNRFDPDNTITTQDAALILVRALKYKGITIKAGSLSEIKDDKDISNYAKEAVGFTVSNGIIRVDSEGNFNAGDTVNRASAAEYIYKVFNFKAV
ncbi:MAG: X2-like carbohydrate binding domain-containing protein [Clostridiaceae bacterium]